MTLASTPNPKLQNVFCAFPFDHIEIQNSGQILQCCESWLPTPIGNILQSTVLEAVASEQSRLHQKSVEDGTFSHCNHQACPYLSRYLHLGKAEYPLVLKADAESHRAHHGFNRGRGITLVLNHDLSCNLSCPSCRSETILHRAGSIPPTLQSIHERVLLSIQQIRDAGILINLIVTGGGDAFASPTYYQMLTDLAHDPGIFLHVKTNGVLMNAARYTPAMRKRTYSISVSLDAFHRETYLKVRRGGSFEAVRNNITWLDSAIRAGEFPSLKKLFLNFVVQKDNYREMVDFARWATAIPSVSSACFNLIENWQHISRTEFETAAVWQVSHPEHEAFLRQAQDPFLRTEPKVHLGNVSLYANAGAAVRTESTCII